jgi:CDP-diacylglycerol--serine O-phosphatidyltransferase
MEPDWRAEERIPIRHMLTPADLLSLGNGLLGFLAIVTGLAGHVEATFSLILVAAILDGMDGAVSRLGHGGGRLGGKLDSFADLVSFVVAPALLFFTAYRDDGFLALPAFVPHGLATGALVFAVAAAYFLTGLLRLARFDYLKGGDRHDYFLGVTTPGGAVVLASIVLVGWDVRPALFVAALTSLLMTSRVRLPKLRGTLASTAGIVLLTAAVLGDHFNHLGPILLLVAFLGYLTLGPGYVRRHTEDEDVQPLV